MLNKKKMINTLKGLVKKLFSKRVRTKRDLQMLWGLQMRAWLTFSFQTLNKMYIMTAHEEYKGLLPICREQCSIDDDIGGTSASVINSEEVTTDQSQCIKNYNIEMVEPAYDFCRVALWIIVLFSFLINILSYRWRSLINLAFYLEGVQHMVTVMIPSFEFQSMTSGYYALRLAIRFLFYYCDTPDHIYFSTVSAAFFLFFPSVAVYQQAMPLG